MRVVGSHHDMVHSEELSQLLYANTDTYFTNGCDQLRKRNLEVSVLLNLIYFWERNRSAIRDGIPLALSSSMGWICQHCGAPFFDSAYRVKSEESGIVLLDIIVCQHCNVEARDLGLHTEKIRVRNSSRAVNDSSSRRKPAFRR